MAQTNIDDLKQIIDGAVITEQDEGYQQASDVFGHSGSPAVIVQAKSAQDVAEALAYARKNELIVSVRSGGHSGAGMGTNDGGMVIDVGPMNEVALLDNGLDAGTNRVRIGAGGTWGDIARQLYTHGLAISSGDTDSVGAAGLVLGGGIGWMVRKYGLTIDSLVGAEVVTADGEVLRASADEHEDLFWALRGGGGNFGIVTTMEFIAQPISDVISGPIMFGMDNAAALVKGWRDYMRVAPEELTTTLTIVPENAMGQNPAMMMVACCWAGDDEAAAKAALTPLRQLATPLQDGVVRKPYHESLEAPHASNGMRVEVNNALFNTLSDATVDDIVSASDEHRFVAQLRSVGGAVARIADDETAYAGRSAEVMIGFPQFIPPDANDEQVQAMLAPVLGIVAGGDGAYVNFFSGVGEREARASYPPETYKRLAAIKKRYDPQNIFCRNVNIRPE